jgi:hypothetical protein
MEPVRAGRLRDTIAAFAGQNFNVTAGRGTTKAIVRRCSSQGGWLSASFQPVPGAPEPRAFQNLSKSCTVVNLLLV